MNIFDKVVRSAIRPGRSDLGGAAAIAAALGVGAGLIYTLDPARGGRRRAVARDKTVSLAHQTGALLDKSARDLRHRSRGVLANVKAMFRRGTVSDDVLSDRVRAKLGRVVSHPHAIGVQAFDGCVTLRGPVLAREVDDLLAAVAAVDGVKRVSNELDVHRSAEGIPSLQGSSARTGERFELMKESWSPTQCTHASWGNSSACVVVVSMVMVPENWHRGRVARVRAAGIGDDRVLRQSVPEAAGEDHRPVIVVLALCGCGPMGWRPPPSTLAPPGCGAPEVREITASRSRPAVRVRPPPCSLRLRPNPSPSRVPPTRGRRRTRTCAASPRRVRFTS
ncbi:BON domain-containing protein [Sorangium sp. So ce1128]